MKTTDAAASVTTGMVLISQAVAFTQFAGHPPQAGLAASVLPMSAYALLESIESSRTLSVGPATAAALMVAAVLSRIDAQPMALPYARWARRPKSRQRVLGQSDTDRAMAP
ncbi:SulP family inorganic anion transporter [Polaromonas sp.]|uniref:SulP family inorganic anion transporter n=1 Tax=Polaromonas sp. TaxID=1869339 RepID=UPI0035240090